MVAKSQSLEERFVPPPAPFLEGRWRVPRFTRKDVETLVRQGIIPEDASTELLSGLVVLKDRARRGEDPLTIGSDHRRSVERLSNLRSRINNPSRHVQSQQPLVCGETHVPEPDSAVIRGRLEDYPDNPEAADAWCVVEVADASYERDAREKLAGYARAGVAQYVILNLRNRTAEVYTNPDTAAGTYPAPRVVRDGEVLSLRVGEGEVFDIRLSDVLP